MSIFCLCKTHLDVKNGHVAAGRDERDHDLSFRGLGGFNFYVLRNHQVFMVFAGADKNPAAKP